MKAKIEIINVVKAFAKAIGVPTALILDPKGTRRSDTLQKAANDMNLPLKFLERRTQWANLAELYWPIEGGSPEIYEGLRQPFKVLGLPRREKSIN